MKKTVIFILHLGYWALYIILLALLMTMMLHTPEQREHTNVPVLSMFLGAIALGPAIVGFYTSYTLLFSRFLTKKKILLLFLSGIATSFLCALLGVLLLIIIAFFIPPLNIFSSGMDGAIPIVLLMSINALLNGGMGLVVKGFITWYSDIKLKEELNRKNYETELELVKSQINPHFLFNTINNIDVLIEKDPGLASVYLNKLSDIMRFMLYETKTEQIPLDKELAYIEKYIDLQKIRTANGKYVQYTVAGNTSDKWIVPMLFIPFIENAFKHAENRKKDNAIRIDVLCKEDNITFVCENVYSIDTQTSLGHGGLGNELIRKRLTLLYGDRHQLEVTQEGGVYKVKLILFLS